MNSLIISWAFRFNLINLLNSPSGASGYYNGIVIWSTHTATHSWNHTCSRNLALWIGTVSYRKMTYRIKVVYLHLQTQRFGLEELLSKSPPQQQSQPRSQSSTSHDSFQFDEMPLPDYVEKLEVESYNQDQEIDQYNAFIEKETKCFESEYSLKKEMEKYALESTPPPRCHISNPLSRPKDQSVAQCMSPRPPTLYVAHEAVIQMYLSRPGHENPYVLRVFDYFILKDKFMLITDYFDESWVSLFSYMNEKIRLDIKDARIIIKKVVNAAISLKQQGVFHNDLHDENVMYNLETGSVKLKNFGATDVLPLWEERRLLQSLDPPSATPKYKAGPSELKSMQRIGQLLLGS
ncbi:hypothetical protein BASA60_004670 [Batrachochytrium salamandrivorans]|nr:hypothetical protein BASA60_004670 [Batrachochytrium salamandrivorans]